MHLRSIKKKGKEYPQVTAVCLFPAEMVRSSTTYSAFPPHPTDPIILTFGVAALTLMAAVPLKVYQ